MELRDEYKLLSECIDRGINYGLNKAYKYADESGNPSRESLEEQIELAITNEICEWFTFKKDPDVCD